jgi:hypothetical protein
MKNLTVSLVACGVLLSSSVAFGASTVDEAFKEGKVSGSLALYGQKIDGKGLLDDGKGDSGYGNGNATVGFETASLNGFTAKAEFKGNIKLGEVEHNDYNTGAPFENHSLMTEAYVKYTNDAFFVSAGRQAIDLEWLADYNESVVAGITAIPDTEIVLGWSQRKAESGIDLSEDFYDINDNKGVYVVDVKYTGFESVEFNPYAYSAPDAVDFYGLKTTFTAPEDVLGVVAHYAKSSVEEGYSDGDGNLYKDGSIGHVELSTKIQDLTAAVGYIKADEDGGAGAMDVAGDNISPLEDGNYVYSADAKTIYGSLGYTIADVELGALYGETEFEQDFKEKELNLTAGYPFTESLAASILYGDVKADKDYGDFDYNKVLASVEYTF